MNRVASPVLMLIPMEALGMLMAVMLVTGGLCMVIGARKAAGGLVTGAIALPFITLIMEVAFNELFAMLPDALVRPVAWLILGIIYLLAFGMGMRFMFGSRAWNGAKERLLADAIAGALRFAFSWPLLLVWLALGTYLWFS
jgi:hypothetical protein